MKKTNIICTIGPSSWDKNIIKQMIDSGMNAARINASFADVDEIDRVSKVIRSVSLDIAIILDTKGHKIRLSDFKKPLVVEAGEEFILATVPAKGKIYTTYKGLENDVSKGSTILIDDGKIELEVKGTRGTDIICKVIQGGELKRGKTVNVPGTHLSFPPITDKDYNDILFAVKNKIDFVAASFIRNVEDVETIKQLTRGSRTKLIAKIEDPEGVANFDSILAEVDGIMVARGDLGIETPPEHVPILQKKFIRKCREAGKPVIVATHMLESMIYNSRPTRAEVNDVANAIYDGTDAIMLSAETSTGKYPVLTVQTMSRIASEVETQIEPDILEANPIIAKPTTNAIAKAVLDICETLPITKILVATATGSTAKSIARHLPKQPIFAFTRDQAYVRSLSLTRGITAAVLDNTANTRDIGIKNVLEAAIKHNFVSDSDLVVIVAGANILGQGSTNLLEVQRVGDVIK